MNYYAKVHCSLLSKRAFSDQGFISKSRILHMYFCSCNSGGSTKAVLIYVNIRALIMCFYYKTT